MKYFVISDVHGFYNEMIKALDEAGFDKANPEHIIINLGDSADRGPASDKVLQFLVDLKDRAILIRGNHEDLMEEAISRGYFESHDEHNGTDMTAVQLTGELSPIKALNSINKCKLWNDYIESCIDYYELDDYIFVHGWIPVSYEYAEGYEDLPGVYRPTIMIPNTNWREDGDWYNARWINGMKAWSLGIIAPGRTIVCGHYHTSWGHCNLHNDGVEYLKPIETFYIDPKTGKEEPHANYDPFIDDGIIALDACTAISHKVNV